MADAAGQQRWYVVRTSIRCEDKAAKALRLAGYRAYVPKLRKTIIHHRTKKQEIRRFALLVRYIFVRMTRLSADGRADWYTLHDCDGVESVLGVNGAPFPIPRTEVEKFMRLQREHKFDDVKAPTATGRQRRALARAKFRRGARLAIKDGPFAGLSASVADHTAHGSIVAMLELFGRLTPVDLQMEQVEAVDVQGKAA